MSLKFMRASLRFALLPSLVLALSLPAAEVQSPIYESATNLQAYLNSFATSTRANLLYIVREGYDGKLTVVDLNAELLSDTEARYRCQTLLADLEDAPAAARVANVWVLSGLSSAQEQHLVCRGRREQ